MFGKAVKNGEGAARNNQHSGMPNIQHNIHSWPPVFLIFLKGIKMHGYDGKNEKILEMLLGVVVHIDNFCS